MSVYPPKIAETPTPTLLGHSDHPRFTHILNVKVGLLDRSQMIGLVRSLIDSKTKGWISYVNIHTINEAHEEPWLRDHINESLFTYCDGMGVLLGGRLLGSRIPERITLADCFDDLCRSLEEQGARVFLLGGSDATVKAAVHSLEEKFPRLSVVGCAHGYFDLSNGIDVLREINHARPDLVFVGMGLPRQEAWIRKNAAEVNAPLFWSAGALFDFLAGTRRRCPRWMGRLGLEWLFRLVQEPHRLWKRYLLGNPIFFWKILRYHLARKVAALPKAS